MRLAGQHDVTQAQTVPMFLYNPLVRPIKQTITPWQIHFNKAPCYYGTSVFQKMNHTGGEAKSLLQLNFLPLCLQLSG